MWQLPEQSTPTTGDIIVLCYKDRSTGQPRIVVGLFYAERKGDTTAWSLRIDGSTALRRIDNDRILGWAPWLAASRDAAKQCAIVAGTHKYKEHKRKPHAYTVDSDTAEALGVVITARQLVYKGEKECPISIYPDVL